MMEFAVWHEGIPDAENGDKQGRWVIAIDGDRFLLADDIGVFYYERMVNCTLFRIVTPDAPRMVIPVQPQPQTQNGLVIAEPNRAMRRNGHN